VGLQKVILLLVCIFSIQSSFAFSRALNRHTYVQVNGTHFTRDGSAYAFVGSNLWYGMNLGSQGQAGDRARLTRDLDRLRALGVTNLRILAGTEGPATEPMRIVPALQNSPGVYDSNLLQGLDFLLSEMGKRDMTAVVVLGDFWHWSGGFAQYLNWAGAGSIPYPPPFPGGDWNTFEAFSSQFYLNPLAQSNFLNLVKTIITRTNSISAIPYSQDTTIMSWELANEPRGMGHPDELNTWIEATSKFIKSYDANHLVTTGCEGQIDSAGLDLVRNSSYPSIDYATVHIWAQNFGWYDPTQPTKTYDSAVAQMKTFLKTNVKLAEQIGKPLVLEEFGLARDNQSYDPKSATTYRDKYYDTVFNEVLTYSKAGEAVQSANFWAWAGEAVPVLPLGTPWAPGNPFLGDPPHEPQGWYSIFANDESTIEIIAKYASSLPGAVSHK
jgi:mannan endo-1,4-beta-mannosidase